ncbi:MAG: two-component system nitrogen regulation sensor histidine kinase GlnL [Pseudohongiellaceae bacterium]
MTPENVHKRLLDTLKTAVILLDENLCLLYINLAAETLLDISDRQAKHSFIGDLFLNAAADINEMQTALTNNRSTTQRKAELRTVHNKSIVVDYTISPFENNGEMQALIELNSLEHTHRISREETLHSAHATTQELVRGLAHEIKNPLGGIRGAAQLLAREIPGNELNEYTNVIIEEADRLRNLVDRMVGSKKPLFKTEINIHEVLERVRSLVTAEIADQHISGIQLVQDYDPSIPTIMADAEQLIQAVLNLVRNAMQSLTSPDIEHNLGKIIIRSRIIRNSTIDSKFHRLAASIDIIDNGPGVPEDLINTIFYPMISGRAEGTGLGLSITHSIISQHEGMIECQSDHAETKFTIVLPLEPTAAKSA